MVIGKLMRDLDDEVGELLRTPVTVKDVNEFPDLGDIRPGRTWARMNDVVAVVADLKGSTRLGMDRYVNSTIRLYRAATGGGVRVACRFGPQFTDIQGDGFFSLFQGKDAYQRGVAAAMSIAYFSKEVLEPAIEKFAGKDCPKTGLKVGVAAGRLAVGRVGRQGDSELVWPGRPVNFAFKCSGAADAHQVIVTQRVFDNVIRENEYLLRPCYRVGHWHGHWPTGEQWKPVPVHALGKTRCFGRSTPWCPEVADEFCQAVLDGETRQPASAFQRFRYSVQL
jgi:class 3 adenylate cyclase